MSMRLRVCTPALLPELDPAVGSDETDHIPPALLRAQNRIEANSAPSARIPAGKLSVPVLRSSPALPLSRRLLQDIGLDDSRKD